MQRKERNLEQKKKKSMLKEAQKMKNLTQIKMKTKMMKKKAKIHKINNNKIIAHNNLNKINNKIKRMLIKKNKLKN